MSTLSSLRWQERFDRLLRYSVVDCHWISYESSTLLNEWSWCLQNDQRLSAEVHSHEIPWGGSHERGISLHRSLCCEVFGHPWTHRQEAHFDIDAGWGSYEEHATTAGSCCGQAQIESTGSWVEIVFGNKLLENEHPLCLPITVMSQYLHFFTFARRDVRIWADREKKQSTAPTRKFFLFFLLYISYSLQRWCPAQVFFFRKMIAEFRRKIPLSQWVWANRRAGFCNRLLLLGSKKLTRKIHVGSFHPVMRPDFLGQWNTDPQTQSIRHHQAYSLDNIRHYSLDNIRHYFLDNIKHYHSDTNSKGIIVFSFVKYQFTSQKLAENFEMKSGRFPSMPNGVWIQSSSFHSRMAPMGSSHSSSILSLCNVFTEINRARDSSGRHSGSRDTLCRDFESCPSILFDCKWNTWITPRSDANFF